MKSATGILKWAVGILLVLAFLAWPYYALFDLARGIQSGDAATINRLVDWDSVRSSVKAQIQLVAAIARPSVPRGSATSAAMDRTATDRTATLAAAGSFIDSVLTPEGVAKMLNGVRSTGPSNMKLSPRELEGLLKQIRFAFFVSPIHFRLDLGTDAPAVTVMMTFKGTGWQITDVKMPALVQLAAAR